MNESPIPEMHISGPSTSDAEVLVAGPATGHEKHCFVVMPSGRETSEQKWFRGWYEVVIKPAVKEAGFEPILAAAEEQPGAINDEIRTHLAVDPMVVVDLGGAEPEDDPNPNVMYELGIRHALGLPLVMMAWKGQRLPFDVGNQRVIMEDRDLVDLDLNRKKIISFIRAAEQGKYYRPMDAVSRLATIEAASESLAEDSLLRALAQEVRELRSTMTATIHPRKLRRLQDKGNTIKHLIATKLFRKELYPHFIANGGTPQAWPRLLKRPVSLEEAEQWQNRGVDEWKAYVAAVAKEASAASVAAPSIQPEQTSMAEAVTFAYEQGIVERVRSALPAQPWPTGIHKAIANDLGLPHEVVSRYSTELIRRGDFVKQVDGKLFPEGD